MTSQRARLAQLSVGEYDVSEQKYNADDIELLSMREAIRKRPGMYIGSTGHAGVEHAIWELTANSIDQVLAGRASRVQIAIHSDDSIEVTDDGPGIDLLSEQVRSYFLQYHPAPTADSHSPHIHIAHFGVGLVVPNALSTRFRVTTRFGDKTLRCEWTQGAEEGGSPAILDEDWTGTSVRMWLNPAIFDEVAVRPGSLDRRIHELNALIPELHLTLNHPQALSTWQSGLASLLDALHGEAPVDFGTPAFMSMRDESDPDSPIDLRICLTTTGDGHRGDRIAAFCNFHRVHEEGTFIRSIRSAIWRTGRATLDVQAPPEPSTTPVRRLALVASITMLAPAWSGPTRSRLDDPRSVAIAERLISTELPGIIAESAALQAILKRAFDAN